MMFFRNPRLTLWAVVASAAAGIALVVATREPESPSPPNWVGAGPLRARPSHQDAAPRVLLADTGAQHHYELMMRADVAATSQRILSYDLEGKWLVEEATQTSAGLTFRARLDGAALRSATAAPHERHILEDFERGLGSVHFFSADERGAIVEARLPRNLPSFVQTTMKWWVAATQFSRGPLGARSWEAQESDASGTYRAQYEEIAPNRFRKRKVEYLTAPPVASGSRFDAQPTEVLESESLFDFGARGSLAKLEVVERTRVAQHGVLPELESTTRLTLRLEDASAATASAAQVAEELERTEPGQLSDPPSRSARRADIDRAKIAGQSLATLTSTLETAAGDHRDDVTKRARAYVGLAALLRQDESARSDAMRRILGGAPDAPALIDALGDAGDLESQRILIDVLDKAKLDETQGRGALIALSLVREPGPDAVAALEARLDDPLLGTQAAYGLGAYAHQLQESEPSLSRSVLDLLIDRLENASDPSEAARYLEALGNAGHPGALPVIDAHLADGSAAIRSGAVRALRRISGAEVDARLAGLVTTDPASGVRDIALGVIGSRPESPALGAAVAASARFEPDLRLRLAAARILGRWMWQEPELLALGQWLAANDPEEKIRATLQRALEARTG
jgi:hypothetical protein